MSDLEKTEKTDRKQNAQARIADPGGQAGNELPPAAPGLLERVRKLLNNVQQRAPGTKQELAKDRTRSLALLIGGTVGAVLLFIGVFSTPTTPPIRQTSGRAAPNLGRAPGPNQPTATQSSVTPLLNADVRSDESNSDQLSPADIQGTSRRASATEISSPPETKIDSRAPRASMPPERSFDGTGASSSAGSNPWGIPA